MVTAALCGACGGSVEGTGSTSGGPPNSFACGALFCDRSTQYCNRTTSDVGGEPDGFLCKALPAGCGAAPDCACAASEPCGNLCEKTMDGGLLVTCLGG